MMQPACAMTSEQIFQARLAAQAAAEQETRLATERRDRMLEVCSTGKYVCIDVCVRACAWGCWSCALLGTADCAGLSNLSVSVPCAVSLQGCVHLLLRLLIGHKSLSGCGCKILMSISLVGCC